MFALLTMAGDLGGAFGPGLVGWATQRAGDDLRAAAAALTSAGEKKNAVKVELEVETPAGAPAQFFKVRFGE